MNIHHLELFYYVARYGGIMEAVRNIPYGIQQPAVSGQVAQLEEFLGVVLFQRRPFALTPAGERLYKYIQPFFANLDSVATELQGGHERQIRIGASTIVLREHLPELYIKVRKKFPDLRITLREGYQADLEAMLQREELDLVITLIEKKSAPGIQSLPLVELPLVLLLPKSSPLTSADQLWKQDKIDEPLICMPAKETICKHFQEGLQRKGIDWFPSIEVSSLDLVDVYVNTGLGIGLSLLVPRVMASPSLKILPLPGFAPVVVGALWRGKKSVLVHAFMSELEARAKWFMGEVNAKAKERLGIQPRN